MTMKNRFAEYFGYVLKSLYNQDLAQARTDLAQIRLAYEQRLDDTLEVNKQNENLYAEQLNKFFVATIEYNKPEPKLKTDVKTIQTAILSQGFHFIGTVQDKFVYIYMYAKQTEMYWLQVNYDGEYCYLMKQINNQDIAALCEIITTPNKDKETALSSLDNLSCFLDNERKDLEVKRESVNTTEYNKLTAKERKTLAVLKNAVALVRKVAVYVRDI